LNVKQILANIFDPMTEIKPMVSNFIKLRKSVRLKMNGHFVRRHSCKSGCKWFRKGNVGWRQFRFLMILYPGAQPMKDAEVDNAGGELQDTGPP